MNELLFFKLFSLILTIPYFVIGVFIVYLKTNRNQTPEKITHPEGEEEDFSKNTAHLID